MTVQFTPDEAIQGDLENAARLLSAEIRSHENGIPEWAKNSSDAYMRDGVPDAQRIIVLLFHQQFPAREGHVSLVFLFLHEFLRRG